MDRRGFLRLGAMGAGVAAVGVATAGCAPEPPPSGLFSLGVASGLHSPTEVVLWTRVDPRVDASVTGVGWELATDPGFASVVARGSADAPPDADRTVKVLVGGLEPGRDHWYRFSAGGTASPVGRARTLPEPGSDVASLRLAFASCQAYSSGWYTSWRQVAGQELDAVLFLGDYIYESGEIQLLGSVRSEPFAADRTLDDYRRRYRLYRSDTDLQAAHAAHPFVTTWDDHEVANDYSSSVFSTDPDRVAAAYRAWFEYQPVWPTDGTRIHRSLDWGRLARLFVLDTRQYRDPHRGDAPLIGTRELSAFEAAEGRTILGAEQRAWLTGGLSDAAADGTTWKVVGNQVMISPIRVEDLDTPEARAADPSLPRHAGRYTNTNFDSWDGYGWERDLVLGHLATGGPSGGRIDNTVFLTGDYHSFWASTLTADFDAAGSPAVAAEFTGGAISSFGGAFNEAILYGSGPDVPASPPFHFVDLARNGHGVAEFTPTGMAVTFLGHDARVATDVPTPIARFTMAAGDPTVATELP